MEELVPRVGEFSNPLGINITLPEPSLGEGSKVKVMRSDEVTDRIGLYNISSRVEIEKTTLNVFELLWLGVGCDVNFREGARAGGLLLR